MPTYNRVGKHKTRIRTENGETTIRYWYTDVVTFRLTPSDTIITLNAGTWFSPTTKLRMNQASRQFGLGYSVYQSKGVWFVTVHDKTYPFHNNMTIHTGAPDPIYTERTKVTVTDFDGHPIHPIPTKGQLLCPDPPSPRLPPVCKLP